MSMSNVSNYMELWHPMDPSHGMMKESRKDLMFIGYHPDLPMPLMFVPVNDADGTFYLSQPTSTTKQRALEIYQIMLNQQGIQTFPGGLYPIDLIELTESHIERFDRSAKAFTHFMSLELEHWYDVSDKLLYNGSTYDELFSGATL